MRKEIESNSYSIGKTTQPPSAQGMTQESNTIPGVEPDSVSDYTQTNLPHEQHDKKIYIPGSTGSIRLKGLFSGVQKEEDTSPEEEPFAPHSPFMGITGDAQPLIMKMNDVIERTLGQISATDLPTYFEPDIIDLQIVICDALFYRVLTDPNIQEYIRKSNDPRLHTLQKILNPEAQSYKNSMEKLREKIIDKATLALHHLISNGVIPEEDSPLPMLTKFLALWDEKPERQESNNGEQQKTTKPSFELGPNERRILYELNALLEGEQRILQALGQGDTPIINWPLLLNTPYGPSPVGVELLQLMYEELNKETPSTQLPSSFSLLSYPKDY